MGRFRSEEICQGPVRAGLHLVARVGAEATVHLFAELRAGPHQAHVPLHDVPELGNSSIESFRTNMHPQVWRILDRLVPDPPIRTVERHLAAPAIRAHRAQLVHRERTATPPHPLLRDEAPPSPICDRRARAAMTRIGRAIRRSTKARTRSSTGLTQRS